MVSTSAHVIQEPESNPALSIVLEYSPLPSVENVIAPTSKPVGGCRYDDTVLFVVNPVPLTGNTVPTGLDNGDTETTGSTTLGGWPDAYT
jgi:hypothetical protein